MRSTRGWRVGAARLGLILGSLFLPVLLLETLFRVAGPFPPGNYDTGVWLVPHPLYGYYHPPDHATWIRRDELTTFVQTNAAGQRGRPVALAKPPGTFRILVLGDSFVEAVQVAEQDRSSAASKRSSTPAAARSTTR